MQKKFIFELYLESEKREKLNNGEECDE